jgi:lipopolysaccharide export system permease protein
VAVDDAPATHSAITVAGDAGFLMLRRVFRPLDRYIFGEFIKIFVGTVLGFPILVVINDLTYHLDSYLNRQIPRGDIALSYVYFLPETAFQVVPAAVLFATVFAIGALTRHSEITAAKASGISFYRLILPILVGATLATGLDLALGEVMPVTTRMRNELVRDERTTVGVARGNFAYASDLGRVYKIALLEVDKQRLIGLEIERKGNGPAYPTYVLSADSARFEPDKSAATAATAGGRWRLQRGQVNVVSDTGTSFMVQFESGYEVHFRERPEDMMRAPRSPQEMRYQELSRFIASAERSGSDVNKLRVERMLKIAIPVTCIIIALFGAPLATSTKRGGTAYGIAVSLGTTVVFLLTIQLTEAFGGKGLISPEFAAWIPGIAFACVGIVLMARVRT